MDQPLGAGARLLSSNSPTSAAPQTAIPNPRSAILNVCFDARMVHYRRAGIGQYTISLLRAFSRLPEIGPSSHFEVLQMRSDTTPIVRDSRFRRVPVWTPPHNRFEQPLLGLELLKLCPLPQLVHSPDFIPPSYRRFPAVANIQDLAFLKFPDLTLLTGESERYYSQVKQAARDAEALIALSHSARDDVVQLLGVKPSKIAIIPAAAGSEFKPPADKPAAQQKAAGEFALPGPHEGGYVLYVGTIEPRKNLVTLLEAYGLLISNKRVLPVPVLAIAGSNGWLYERVLARIGELRLKKYVRLLGRVPDRSLPTLYQGARLFALPSLYEGFGLPALEALACATPTLASNAGSLPEVVASAGILLDPNDPDAWAASMERVLLDEHEQERLRSAGPVQAANFSWPKAAAQTWALYKEVLGIPN